eukprot:scaffold144_cov159-Skeletonema_menzelii.AAC.1
MMYDGERERDEIEIPKQLEHQRGSARERVEEVEIGKREIVGERERGSKGGRATLHQAWLRRFDVDLVVLKYMFV